MHKNMNTLNIFDKNMKKQTSISNQVELKRKNSNKKISIVLQPKQCQKEPSKSST